MKILLTFTGFHDPFSLGLVGEEEQPGPILSLLGIRAFDRVYLLSTLATERNTVETEKAIKASCPDINVSIIDFPLDDPTDYYAIIQGLRERVFPVFQAFPKAEFAVSVASGTPQMHVCWVLLTGSGEFPARILHIRPPRFVTRDRPLVSEVALADLEVGFSLDRFPDSAEAKPETIFPPSTPDLDRIVRKLGIIGDHPRLWEAIEIADQLAESTDFARAGTGRRQSE